MAKTPCDNSTLSNRGAVGPAGGEGLAEGSVLALGGWRESNGGGMEGARDEDLGVASGAAADAFDSVQVSDQAIMAHMRTQSGTSILELAEKLSVTDTAVRQRLNRLMDRGLVERYAVREGRGRPKHVYRLTELGMRASGANLDDLAVALWQELVCLEDVGLRERLLRRVVERMAARYAAEVHGVTPEQRLRSVVELFNRRGIPFAFERVTQGGAGRVLEPVLESTAPDRAERDAGAGQACDRPAVGRLVVLGCPYPGLKDDQRLVCRMEQMLFQRLIGVPMADITPDAAGGCCSFVPLQSSGMGGEAIRAMGAVGTHGSTTCGKAECGCR